MNWLLIGFIINTVALILIAPISFWAYRKGFKAGLRCAIPQMQPQEANSAMNRLAALLGNPGSAGISSDATQPQIKIGRDEG